MERRLVPQSVLKGASPELITSMGQAMIVFATIEGFVNFSLHGLIRNRIVWEQLRHAPIVRRLHLLSQLHIESGLAERDVKPVINRAIKVFSARNHIAHNPVTFGKDGQRISRLGAQADRNEMSADDIFRVAQEADNVYNDVVELHFRKVIVDFESAPPKEQ